MTLHAEMRQICFELNWLAQGKIAAYNTSGRGQEQRLPHHIERDNAPGDWWWRKFNEKVGTALKLAIKDQAQEELEHWKKRPVVDYTQETTDDLASRVVLEGEGWALNEIANHCRCTPTFARNARRSHGCNVETGIPEKTHLTDERAYAQDLASKGMSKEGIRMVLKCGTPRLEQLLRPVDMV